MRQKHISISLSLLLTLVILSYLCFNEKFCAISNTIICCHTKCWLSHYLFMQYVILKKYIANIAFPRLLYSKCTEATLIDHEFHCYIIFSYIATIPMTLMAVLGKIETTTPPDNELQLIYDYSRSLTSISTFKNLLSKIHQSKSQKYLYCVISS